MGEQVWVENRHKRGRPTSFLVGFGQIKDGGMWAEVKSFKNSVLPETMLLAILMALTENS